MLTKAKRWVRRTVSAVRMRRVDDRPIPARVDESRLFMVVRDEELRLPYTLHYYFSLGVNRIFILDNGSKDKTLEVALSHENVHVLRTPEPFLRKAAWMDLVLRRFGLGYWCVVADADELFVYPNIDRLSLGQLAAHMDKEGSTAVHALLLDMYGRGPVDQAFYSPNQDPLEVCSYFDPASHRRLHATARAADEGPHSIFVGGVRERVFGLRDVCLSKIPFFCFREGTHLGVGAHRIEGARMAPWQGLVLHFKFMQDLEQRATMNAVRDIWTEQENRDYLRHLGDTGFCSLFGPESTRLEGEDQLRQLGLMTSTPELDAFAGRPKDVAP